MSDRRLLGGAAMVMVLVSLVVGCSSTGRGAAPAATWPLSGG